MFMSLKRRDTRVRYSGTMRCTREAYVAYKEELKDITEKQIPEMTKEKSIAREKGDLRENSEYDAAKHKLIELSARKRWIEERIENVVIVQEEQVRTDTAGFGCHVILKDKNGKESGITLAGEWDDVPEEDIISIESPLGLAITGKRQGDEVTLGEGDNAKTYTISSLTKSTDLFGHYAEHHPKKVEEETVVKKVEKKVMAPKEALDQLFALAQAGKEKEEMMAFLSDSGDKPADLQPIAMDTLSAKGDMPSAIKALNALNEWCRMENIEEN